MLKLLLDEHISPEVANGLRRHGKGLFVWPLNECEEGLFLGFSDEVLLGAAARAAFCLQNDWSQHFFQAWLETGVSTFGSQASEVFQANMLTINTPNTVSNAIRDRP